jgi:RNA polymerase sigma-70 factor (ECF subfamily)
MNAELHRPSDDLVLKARTQADALGQLYEVYYRPIFQFCVHRLFDKSVAEDVTSSIFLSVAKGIRTFKGRTEQEFRGWLYAIAANQANAYIRQTSRRSRISSCVVHNATIVTHDARRATGDESELLDWPTVYAEILKLKPKYQTVVTLRFFEGLNYEEIGRIVDARAENVRVILHRSLSRLRRVLADSR